MLRGLRLPGAKKVYAAADSTHTNTKGENLVQPASQLIDRIRRRYAQQLHAHHAKDMYVPTQGRNRALAAQGPLLLPDLQHEAHVLATAAIPSAQSGNIHFAAEAGELGGLARGQLPYLRHSQAMEEQYKTLAAPMPRRLRRLHGTALENHGPECRPV